MDEGKKAEKNCVRCEGSGFEKVEKIFLDRTVDDYEPCSCRANPERGEAEKFAVSCLNELGIVWAKKEQFSRAKRLLAEKFSAAISADRKETLREVEGAIAEKSMEEDTSLSSGYDAVRLEKNEVWNSCRESVLKVIRGRI